MLISKRSSNRCLGIGVSLFQVLLGVWLGWQVGKQQGWAQTVAYQAALTSGQAPLQFSGDSAGQLPEHNSDHQQAVDPEPSAEQAVSALRALGAAVKTDAQGRVVLVDLAGKATDQSAKHLAQLRHLRSLRWTGPEVTDATAQLLVGLPNLKVLKLDETRLTDAGLARLKQLTQLEELYLGRTPITDAGLEHVGQMAGLRRLRLSETKITGSGLAKLAPLKELVELDVSRTALDDASLAVLTKLPKLARINLYTTPIGDAGLDYLAQMVQLTWLNLDNTQITDAGLPKLRNLKNLEFLHLGRTRITDAGLAPLAELKRLKTLHLTNTAVTAEGAARLQQALPGCNILVGTSQPSKSAPPTQPHEQTKPTEPAKPTGQFSPAEPAKPTEQSSPAKPARPTTSSEPVRPTPGSDAPHSKPAITKPTGPPRGSEGKRPSGPTPGSEAAHGQPPAARGVQVRLECTVRQYDPAKPDGLLIGIVENLSDNPIEVPASYESQRLLLWAKAEEHPMASAYWDRSREKPAIPMVRLAPGQKQEVFRWPLAEVLADRHKTWQADYQAGRRLLVWDWEHHAHPPYSPIYQVNSTQLVPKAEFWLELNLDGQTIRSEKITLHVKTSSAPLPERLQEP
ncbi:MAG: hypothetical protein NZ602_10885 [Thermoguttaceae bacterium]|nr:hypothetical protein [Thermoguttaceae bacterium]MDW8038537.1 hypothetical protein [Thermoguttaceae bacterium]